MGEIPDCLCDLLRVDMDRVGHVNHRSLGFQVFLEQNSEIYRHCNVAAVAAVAAVCTASNAGDADEVQTSPKYDSHITPGFNVGYVHVEKFAVPVETDSVIATVHGLENSSHKQMKSRDHCENTKL